MDTSSSVGQNVQLIPVSLVNPVIVLTQLDTKTLEGFPEVLIQYRATVLSIHTVVGCRLSALCRFVTMFAAICLLINCSHAMDVFRFQILQFDIRRPLTTPMITVEYTIGSLRLL